MIHNQHYSGAVMRVREILIAFLLVACFSNLTFSARIWDEEGVNVGHYKPNYSISSILWQDDNLLFGYEHLDASGNKCVALQMIDQNGNLLIAEPLIVSDPSHHNLAFEESVQLFSDGIGGIIITYMGMNEDDGIYFYFSHLNENLEIRGFRPGRRLWEYRFRPPDAGVDYRFKNLVQAVQFHPETGYTLIAKVFSHLSEISLVHSINRFKYNTRGDPIEGQPEDGERLLDPSQGLVCSRIKNESIWIGSLNSRLINCYSLEDDELIWGEPFEITSQFLSLTSFENGDACVLTREEDECFFQRFNDRGPVYADNEYLGIGMEERYGYLKSFSIDGIDYFYFICDDLEVKQYRIVDNNLELVWAIRIADFGGPETRMLENDYLLMYDHCFVNDLDNVKLHLISDDGEILFGDEGILLFEEEDNLDLLEFLFEGMYMECTSQEAGGVFIGQSINGRMEIFNLNRNGEFIWEERHLQAISSGVGQIGVVQSLGNEKMRLIYTDLETISYNIINTDGRLELIEPELIVDSQAFQSHHDLLAAHSGFNALLAGYSRSNLYFINEEGRLLPEDNLFHVGDFGEGSTLCRFNALTGDSLGGFWIALRNGRDNRYEIVKLNENAEWLNEVLIRPFPDINLLDHQNLFMVEPLNNGSAWVYIENEFQEMQINFIDEELELKWDEAMVISPPQENRDSLIYSATWDRHQSLYLTLSTLSNADIDMRTMMYDAELEPLWDDYVVVFDDSVEDFLWGRDYSPSIQTVSSVDGDIWILLKTRHWDIRLNQWFLQKINQNGELFLDEGGLRLPNYFGKRGSLQLIPDVEGGIWITGAQGDFGEFSESRVIHLDMDGNPIDEVDEELGELAFPGLQRSKVGTEKCGLIADDGLLAIFDVGHDNNFYKAQLFGDERLDAIEEEKPPIDFRIEGLYPNPFNSTTKLEYSINRTSRINISIYNVNGQLVKSVYHGIQFEGVHSQTINSKDLSSGTYFLVIEPNGQLKTQKMIMVN